VSRKLWGLAVFLFILFLLLSVFVFGFSNAYGYTPAGVALISCILFPIGFFAFLWIEAASDSWRATMNPWVIDVEHMDFLFNPMFFPWLYANNRKRWAKWTIGSALPGDFVLGGLLVSFFIVNWVTLVTLLIGFSVGYVFTTLVAIAYYKTSFESQNMKPQSMPDNL
jgi:hypothetical protein